MASVRFLLLCGLLALPAHAQLLGQPYPHFEWRADPPSPRLQVVAGYVQAGGNSNQAAAVGHRYFYDAAAHTYYGYDIVIQPERQGDGYRAMYYDLSIGPLDFSDGLAAALDPTIWKKLPLAALPAPHTIKVSETLENVVFVASTGQKLIDSMSILPGSDGISLRRAIGNTQQSRVVFVDPSTKRLGNLMPMPQGISSPTAIINPQQAQIQLRHVNGSSPVRYFVFRAGGSRAPEGITIPTVSGTAREFSADDAEMHIQRARVSINGVRQELTSPSLLATGSLVWFYVPQHGRYILSLSPRAELGFVKTGEIRGGTVSFTMGDDRVQLESPTAIAPGDAPYLLYVLHDPDWAPTAQAQSGSLLFGSVSPAELAALTRK